MKESTIQKKISDWLSIQGWCVKVISANKRGCPDILACVDGRFVAIEVKRPGGVLSEIQKSQLTKIRSNGGIAIVATSVSDVAEQMLGTIEG